jgi:hypothetical protein
MSAVLKSAAAHPSACANCATALNGKFCHACGQRAHVHKSLLHLGEEVLHGVLHFDAKGLRTLPMLVAKPGQLTRRYIDGHRTRYVSPLARFMFMVVVMFSVAALTGGKAEGDGGPRAVASVKARLDQNIVNAKADVAKARAALAQAKGDQLADAQEEVDGALAMQAALENSRKEVDMPREGKARTRNITANTGWKPADDALRHAAANPELTLYKLKNAGSTYSFLLVPISLPFLWLLFWSRRDITMYDHAVFSLYSLSFMALMFSLLFILRRLGLDLLAIVVLLGVPPVHMFLQLRGTYVLGRGAALWRTAALLMTAGLVFVLYLIVILILSVN